MTLITPERMTQAEAAAHHALRTIREVVARLKVVAAEVLLIQREVQVVPLHPVPIRAEAVVVHPHPVVHIRVAVVVAVARHHPVEEDKISHSRHHILASRTPG